MLSEAQQDGKREIIRELPRGPGSGRGRPDTSYSRPRSGPHQHRPDLQPRLEQQGDALKDAN
jgi:hypothetical protein